MPTPDSSTLKFAFCGSRFSILDEMLKAELKITDIAAVAESPLKQR